VRLGPYHDRAYLEDCSMSMLEKEQHRMRARQMTVSNEVPLHREKRMSRPQPEFIGPTTRRQLMREGLETKIRDLRARLDHFEERRRGQHEDRYATEIRYVTPLELAALDQPGSVFRLQ